MAGRKPLAAVDLSPIALATGEAILDPLKAVYFTGMKGIKGINARKIKQKPGDSKSFGWVPGNLKLQTENFKPCFPYPLPYYQQCQPWDQIEHQEEDLEKPQKRIKDYVKGFPGNGKEPFLGAVHQVRHEHPGQGPDRQDAAVDDRAPHEESCKCLNVQVVHPRLFPIEPGTLGRR
jgi:hypothetical protein